MSPDYSFKLTGGGIFRALDSLGQSRTSSITLRTSSNVMLRQLKNERGSTIYQFIEADAAS
jgi:hypothetical protein